MPGQVHLYKRPAHWTFFTKNLDKVIIYRCSNQNVYQLLYANPKGQ